MYAAGYRQEALKIKQEYHNFRSKIAQMMLLYASVLVFAMWHAASTAEKETNVHHGTFAAFNGVLRHSFSPIIMVSVQARPAPQPQYICCPLSCIPASFLAELSFKCCESEQTLRHDAASMCVLLHLG